ncbi:MAG: NAD-dependent epimerase/dehydratase family protein [Opitutaceae bacterium]|nr:NAD-dependent epimerase/dehydratase family protein [Opitutaceae bacterium]
MSADAPENFFGKRLVVFGAGYLGGAVAREAAARGMRVTALTRDPAKARDLAAAGVDAVVGELADDAWHERVAGSGADFVLNCVGADGGGLEAYRKSYVDGMRSVAGWAAKKRGASSGVAGAGQSGIGVLVYTSSTSVYPQTGGAVVDEDAPCDARAAGSGGGERAFGTGTTHDEHAALLLEAERLALAMHAEGAARAVTVLRLAGIYGPGRHRLLDELRAGADELPGRGDYFLNLVHRDDAAGAIWAAFSRAAARRILNIADDSAATRGEICGWLARQLGRPAPRFSGVAAGGRRAALPNRLVASHRAREQLGWRPSYPTFREGFAPLLAQDPRAR